MTKLTTSLQPVPRFPSLPCLHRGDVISTQETVNRRKKDVFPIYECRVHGKCAAQKMEHSHGLASCFECRDRNKSLIQVLQNNQGSPSINRKWRGSKKENKGMLAIVTCHFNPCGYTKNVENYFRFRESIGRKITVVELSFDGNFIEPNAIQIHGDIQKNCMWQKERLINIAIESLPEEYDKVAWIDADTIFLDPNWFEQAEEALEEFDAIQLAQGVHYTNRDGKIVDYHELFSYSYSRHNKINWRGPGHAWAAKRSVLSKGLYDAEILGGGDSALVFSWIKDRERWLHRYKEMQGVLNYYNAWSNQLPEVQINCLEGESIHLWHGERTNRKYVERTEILKRGSFDPFTDIFKNPDGIWEWTPTEEQKKIEMQNGVRKYFVNRKEDG